MSEDEDQRGYESALEPLDLIRRSDLVVRAGVMMLAAGTSSLRVRELMRAVAASLDIDSMSAQVTFTDVVTTIGRRGIYRTKVAEIASPGVNAHRIAQLQALTRELPERLTLSDMDATLSAVEETKPLYPTWLLTLFVSLACASVAVLTHAGVREVVAVIVGAALGYGVRVLGGRHEINHLATVLTSAAVSCAGFVITTKIIDAITSSTSDRMAAGFICAAIFLIPGFPLVTGGLDLGRIDLNAGVPRVVYALMVLLAITIGVWLVAASVGVSPDPVPALTGAAWVVWSAQVAASFFAVFGWALMFNSPWKVAVASGVVAIIGNVPRLVMLEHGVPVHVATFIACFIMGLGCAAAGRLFDMEKIIMTVPTVLVAIPGSSALRTLIYFDQADVMLAVENGIATVLVVIAMVAGLAGARMLTDPEWTFTRPDRPLPTFGLRRRRAGRGRAVRPDPKG